MTNSCQIDGDWFNGRIILINPGCDNKARVATVHREADNLKKQTNYVQFQTMIKFVTLFAGCWRKTIW